MTSFTRRLHAVALAALALLACAPAAAQDYPARPIRFVVAFPPGSGIDTMSRVLIDEIRKATNATIVVEYKPGALGQIGTDFTAKAPADGYTVMASSSATHSSGAQLAKSVPYDAIRDFTHVGQLARFHVFLVTSPQRGFRTVADLVAEAKRSPGKLSYGFGSGTARVVAAAFARSAGIDVLAVPYKGQPPALTDLMGGQIDFVTADLAVIQTHLKSGRLTALAIAAERRSALLPGVPTLGEQGIRDVELSGWVGVSGPAGMPREAVTWWNTQMNRALGSKEFIERLHAMSLEGGQSSVEEFNQLVRAQFQVWGQRIREAGIPLE